MTSSKSNIKLSKTLVYESLYEVTDEPYKRPFDIRSQPSPQDIFMFPMNISELDSILLSSYQRW